MISYFLKKIEFNKVFSLKVTKRIVIEDMDSLVNILRFGFNDASKTFYQSKALQISKSTHLRAGGIGTIRLHIRWKNSESET